MKENNTMAGHNLRDALVDEIRDLYNAEKQLLKALPKMAKSATSDELRAAFEAHLGETEEQITRLERVFELLDEKPRGKHCAGMAGILEEGADTLAEDMEDSVKDASLIAGAQRVEHYEIAAYGTAMAWAEALDLGDVAKALSETLDEEKAANATLSALAESGINEAATTGESVDDDDEDEDAPAAASRRPAEAAPLSAKSARSRGGRR
jgi:ferritin-like metal-binding protein YciE